MAEADEPFVVAGGERRLPRARLLLHVIDARLDAQRGAAELMRDVHAARAARRGQRQIDAVGGLRHGGDAQLVAPGIERGVEREVAGVDDVAEEDLAAGEAERAIAVAAAGAARRHHGLAPRVLDGVPIR